MAWLNNISIKYKLLLLTGISGLGFLVYLILNIQVSNNNVMRLELVHDVHFPVMELIGQNKAALANIKQSLNAAENTKQQAQLDAIDKIARKVRVRFNNAAQINPGASEIIDKLAKNFDDYYSSAKELSHKMIAGAHSADDLQNLMTQMRDSLQQYENNLDSYQEDVYNNFTASLLDTKDASERAVQVGFILGLLGILIMAGITHLMNRSISSSLSSVNDKLAELANGKGDLTQRLAVKGKDEIGQLSRHFNSFVQKLDEMIGTTVTSIDFINHASTEIAIGNVNLSQRTEEQSSSTEQALAIIEDITHYISDTTEDTSKVTEMAQNARHHAEEGGRAVNDAVTGMQEITAASHKIADIINVINDISFKTNLLSLNAAVEAARAGEHGRGFSVVASEVRELAMQSAASAKEIKTLIQDSTDKVEQGAELVNRSGETLLHIVKSTEDVSNLISKIAAASHQQTNGAQQASSSMANIEQVTQQNAALVEEAAAASNALKQETRRLREMVSFFTVSAHSQAGDSFMTTDSVSDDDHENPAQTIHYLARHK